MTDFMNELKLHWIVNNFSTLYYNPKQLWWQQYQTTSIEKTSLIKKTLDFYTRFWKVQLIILSSALECT